MKFNDTTGILQGYYDRMHPTVQNVIQMISDPLAEIDITDMSLVWRGWVKSSVMKELFGDVYDKTGRPGGSNSWATKIDGPKTYLYGTWIREHIVELRFDREMPLGEVIKMLSVGSWNLALEGWGCVTEAMLMIVEDEGRARLKMRIRGWRNGEVA